METFWTVAAACAAIAAIATVVAFVWRGIKWIPQRYRRSRRGLYRALNRLGPEVRLEHFHAVLGMEPQIVSAREHVYVHRWFYAQVVTNESGNVIMYAITTRDPKFNPSVWGAYGLQGEHRLGEATYKQLVLEGMHTGAMAWRNLRRFYYMESVGSGNWNGYLTLIVGYNDAGTHFDSVDPNGESGIADPADPLPEEHCSGFEFVQIGDLDTPHAENEMDKRSLGFVEAYFQDESVRRWRRRGIPNTYAVVGPLERPTVVSHIGPDKDSVRILPPNLTS
jgi:hypothetical protein